MIHGTADFPVGVYNLNFDSKSDVLFPLHYHREFEILVITKGKVKLQLEGTTVYLAEGEGIFINSGMLHSAVQEEGVASGFTAIVFLPEFIASEYEELYKRYIRTLMKNELIFSHTLPQEAVSLALETSRIFQTAEFGYELAVKGNLTRILARCIAGAERDVGAGSDHKADSVRMALDYIHENYGSEISLSELAAHAHVSREHLCRIFREVSEFSPIVYLNRYRIIQSAYMLQNTDKSISEIASCCGFNHCSYFNKLFLRFMKCSPTEYRRGRKER